MLQSFDFLKNKLELLSEKFQDVKFRYQFDEFNGDHIIEVTPDMVYANSKEYALAESALIKEFVSNFMYESILFISDKSVIKVAADAITYYKPRKISSWIGLLDLNNPIYFKSEEKACVKTEKEFYNYELAA